MDAGNRGSTSVPSSAWDGAFAKLRFAVPRAAALAREQSRASEGDVDFERNGEAELRRRAVPSGAWDRYSSSLLLFGP